MLDDVCAEGGRGLLAGWSSKPPLGMTKPHLPVVAAVDHDDDAAAVEAAEDCVGVVGPAGDAHPEDVDGGAEVMDLEAGAVRGRWSGGRRRRRSGRRGFRAGRRSLRRGRRRLGRSRSMRPVTSAA